MGAGLIKKVGCSQEKISEIVSGFASIKFEPAVRSIGIAFVYLDITNVTAKLQRMLSYHLREVIGNLVGVVVLSSGTVWETNLQPGIGKADGGKAFILSIRR